MINIYTHNRTFHSDELVAIMLLIKYYIGGNKQYQIIRTRDKDILEKAKYDNKSFVIDVGFDYNPENLNFDHHQNNSNLFWDDGTSLSSCGLIWKWLRDNKYLHQHMNNKTMDLIEDNLIKKVDEHDNGNDYWPVSEVLCGFNRKSSDDNVINKQFEKALKITQQYFDNFLYDLKGMISDEKSSDKAIKQSEYLEDIVISDNGIKTGPIFISKHTNKKLFISPRTSNSWIIRAIPINPKEKKYRVYMPETWRGLSEEELNNISGLENLIFCHKSGYMCMMNGSKEDAINIAKKILES